MDTNNALRGSRIISAFWLAIALGSCTVVQYNYELHELPVTDTKSNDCGEFVRSVRDGHVKPTVPVEDITGLNEEAIIMLLFDYADALKEYIERDEAYLEDDIARYREKCRHG